MLPANRRLGGTSPGHSAKPHSAEPLHDRNQRIITKEGFGELFTLFYQAVSHEVGNSLNAVQYLAMSSGDERLMQLFENIHLSFKRIGLLQQLSTEPAFEGPNMLLFFSPKERAKLCLNKGNLGARIDQGPIKEIGLEEVRRFGMLLQELHTNSEGFEVKDEFDNILFMEVMRAVEFGTLLSNSLEELMLGTLDLEAENVSLRVGAVVDQTDKCCLPIDVIYQSDDLKDIMLQCNPIFTTLIFKNIVSNATHAIHQKDLDQSVVLYTYSKDNVVHFEFTDKGIGMPQSHIDNLNSGVPFSTKEGLGHGMGFQYCRELAEKMGGKLYVKSSIPDVGTTVTLELQVSS
jgi:signal transduction histidine kinase